MTRGTGAAITARRQRVLDEVADAIVALPAGAVRRVAVDGVDGAGKTVFADELGGVLRRRRVPVVRASVDGFHAPREVRYRRGRDSPEGFYRDSYDYAALRRELLDPLAPGGDRRFRRAVHDVATDRAVAAPLEQAPADAVLVLDGIFLHRLEVRGCWDLSVWLAVELAESVRRCAERDGTPPDPEAGSNRRYVEGQRRYVAESSPAAHATVVVDNTEFAAPRILRRAFPL